MSPTRFTLTLCSLALIGCMGSPGEDPTSITEEGLSRPIGGGGYRTGFTCEGLQCTCTGDADCNDMFGSGRCGDISSCDTSEPTTPVCKCLVVRAQGRGTTQPPGSKPPLMHDRK